jgi:aerobic-type carbon monoxide dehydrogenase small subunit (CoxS/CutS family)
MVCHALASIHPNPPDIVIDDWLQSNICRCTCYEEIGAAIRAVLSDKIE